MERSGKLKIWVEIISALGVILGLSLVAWELRQNRDQAVLNTRAIEVAAYQDLISQISELNRVVIENPAFADLQLRFFSGDTDLTRGEQNQMASLLWLLFRHGDMAFYQYERGVLDRERLASVLGPMTSRMSIPRMRDEWAARRAVFSVGYQAYVDSLFASR